MYQYSKPRVYQKLASQLVMVLSVYETIYGDLIFLPEGIAFTNP